MIELFSLVGSLHFKLISLIRLILEQNHLYDLNNSQVFILMTIGDGEFKSSEFKARGYTYYSVLGLVDKGYATWNPNPHDQRSGFYQLTDKGLQVVKLFHHLFQDQEHQVANFISGEEFDQLITMLDQIDAFYVNQINQRPVIENR